MYPKEYNGEGRLYKNIINYQLFGMWFSEIIMFGILIAVFGQKYIFMCIIFMGIQITFFIIKTLGQYVKIDKFKKWLASNYATIEEEREFLDQYRHLLSD